MNESYEQELQTEIDFLYDELAYLQNKITNARKANDRRIRPPVPGISAHAETVFEAVRGTGKADGRGRGRTGGVQWSVTQHELYHGI